MVFHNVVAWAEELEVIATNPVVLRAARDPDQAREEVEPPTMKLARRRCDVPNSMRRNRAT